MKPLAGDALRCARLAQSGSGFQLGIMSSRHDAFSYEQISRFSGDDAVGWIAPDGRLVPVPLHAHLDAIRNAPELAEMLPEAIDWEMEASDVMGALYGHGWGRIGTFASDLAGGYIELECFIEHLPALERRAEGLAAVLGRKLSVSPVFTREDAAIADKLSRKGRVRRKPRPPSEPLLAVAGGHAVGWLSPEGVLWLADPHDPVGFCRHAGGNEGLAAIGKRLRQYDSQYEAWQSRQFCEYRDSDDHPDWHRFFAYPYPCSPPVAAAFRNEILAKGWGFVEQAGPGKVRLSTSPGMGNAERLRNKLAGMAGKTGVEIEGAQGADADGDVQSQVTPRSGP